MNFVVFLVIVVGLFESVSSQDQECTDKEIKSSVKKFQNKCLEEGTIIKLLGSSAITRNLLQFLCSSLLYPTSRFITYYIGSSLKFVSNFDSTFSFRKR